MSRTWTDSYSKFSNLDSDEELDESVSSSNKSSQQQRDATDGTDIAFNGTEKSRGSSSDAKSVAVPTCFDWGSGSAVTPNDSFAFRTDADFARMHARVKALPQVRNPIHAC